MLIVKGVNLYPGAVQNLLFAFRPRLTGAFRILLERPGSAVTPPLRIRLEHGADVGTAELPALEAEIVARCRADLRITPSLDWVAPGGLPVAAHKARLVEIAGADG